MISFDIVIKESPGVINKRVQRDAVPELNKLFTSKMVDIKKTTQRLLEKNVRARPEWYSISSGILRGQFGLPDGLRRLENILFIWLDSIQVQFKSFRLKGSGYSGGIKIEGVPAGFKDVLGFRDAKFITEKGDVLKWLKWILLDGNREIIKGYFIGRGKGRAYNNIMLKSKGTSWGVPPVWQGTKEDNFITRAVFETEMQLEKEIEKLF